MDYTLLFEQSFGQLLGNGAERKARCRWHEDRNPSLWANVERGVYFCHVCGAKGGVRTLAKNLGVDQNSIEPPETGLGPLRARLRRLGKEQTPLRIYPESWLQRFLIPHSYWLERGFTDATIERFELGYDALTDRVTIPLRGPLGHLYGVTSRVLDGSYPKYYYPEGFKLREYLYGAWLLQPRDREVVLVEGQLDAIKCWQAGVPALAIMGSTLHLAQLQQLRRMDIRTVRLFLDNDLAGKRAKASALQLLDGFRVQVVEYEGDDPGGLPEDAIRRVVDAALDRYQMIL